MINDAQFQASLRFIRNNQNLNANEVKVKYLWGRGEFEYHICEGVVLHDDYGVNINTWLDRQRWNGDLLLAVITGSDTNSFPSSIWLYF